MKTRRMFWSLLTIALGVYAGLCLVFFLFQRSFVCMPTPVIAASHDELVPLADTRRLVAAFPPDVATLKVVDGTDHNSVSAEAEFREALVNGR